MNMNRAGSSVLLAGGVLLVFAGLSTALEFTIAGMIASAAAITALLYAGGVWFGETPRADPSLVLFTREMIIASGPLTVAHFFALAVVLLGAALLMVGRGRSSLPM